MKKIKSAVLINSVFGAGGGAEVIATHLTEGLNKRGIQTHYITGTKLKDSEYVSQTPRNPLDFILGRIFLGKDITIERIFRKFTGLNDIFFFWPFFLILNKKFREADIVILQNLHGHFFSILALPLISRQKTTYWTLHDTWAILGKSPTIDGECNAECFTKERCIHMDDYPKMYANRTRFLKKLKRWLYKKSNLTIICPSEWLKNEVIKSEMFGKEARILSINNGIDLKRFKNLDKYELRREFGLPQNKKIVFFQAAWVNNREKGILDAIKKIDIQDKKSVHFVLMGHFSQELVPIFQEQKCSVTPLGYTDNDTAVKYFAACDLLAFPSWYENLSTTMIECLAAGTPVVAFDTGGNREIVDHGEDGYIAKWKDYKDFWDGVNQVLKYDKRSEEGVSSHAKKKVKNRFSKEVFLENYFSLFNSNSS